MLGKLIKHDFRAFSRTLCPLQIGVLGGGVLATILTRVIIAMVGANAQGVASGFLFVLAGFLSLLTGLLGMAILASALVTLVLICIRVQKSFFESEGYLTFSLPVTTENLLWSKIITGTLWLLINGVVIAVTLTIFAAFGTASGTFVNASVFDFFGGLFGGFADLFAALFSSDATPGMWAMALIGVLDLLAFALLQILSLYFAVIAGGMMAKKHKLLAAIGVYLAINFCLGFITSVCGVLAVLLFSTTNPLGAVWLTLIGALIVLCGIDAGLFFWARHLLKNKLNLQ